MKIRKALAMLLALLMVLTLVPFSAAALEPEPIISFNNAVPLRAFPQRGMDSGIMVDLTSPSDPSTANAQILMQFARLLEPGRTHERPRNQANQLSSLFNTTHGGTNSLFIVDPATRNASNVNDFRMILLHALGTGGGAITSDSYRVTTCETHGYGMLLLVLLAGSEDTIVGHPFNVSMRTILHRNLPTNLRNAIPVSQVSFQTYYDAMFRTTRQFSAYPRLANGSLPGLPTPNGTTTSNNRGTSILNGQLGGNQWQNTEYRGGPISPGVVPSYQMAWSIHHRHNSGNTPGNFRRESGMSSATDGTMDMAYSLLLAQEQWGSAPSWGPDNATQRTHTYLQYAQGMISDIWETGVHHSRHVGAWGTNATTNPGYFLKISSSAGNNTESGRLSRPSDHMIQHLRAFNAVCINPDSNWQRVIDVTLDSHRFVRQSTAAGGTSTGLLPDFIRRNASSNWSSGNVWEIPQQNFAGCSTMASQFWCSCVIGANRFHETCRDGAVHWNACRVPWRLGNGVMFGGAIQHENLTLRATHDWHRSTSTAAGGVWAPTNDTNGIRGRWLNGNTTRNDRWNHTGPAFRGSMLVPAAIYGDQTWFNGGWAAANASSSLLPTADFQYFGEYINILTMISASGNEWNPVGGTLTIVGGHTVGNRTTVRRIVPGATVRLTPTSGTPNWVLPAGVNFTNGTNATSNPAFFIMPNQSITVTNGTTGPNRTVTRAANSTVPADRMTISPTSGPAGTQIEVTVTPPPNQQIVPGTFSVTGTGVNATITGNIARFPLPDANTSITVNAVFEPRSTEPEPNDMAVAFVYMFTDGGAWSDGFNNAATGAQIEFDITRNSEVRLALPAWPSGGSGMLHDEHRDIYILQPSQTLNSRRLPVRLHQININGTPVSATMPAASAPLTQGWGHSRWTVTGTMGTRNPINFVDAFAGLQSAVPAAQYELITFYPAQTAFQIQTGNLVEFVFHVGTGPGGGNLVNVVSEGATGASANPNPANAGQTVTLNAGTRANHNFTGWSVTQGGPFTINNNSSATNATFSMPNNPVTVTAGWSPQTFNLTRNAATGGTVGGPSGSIGFGTSVTLTATPNANQHFVNWTGSGLPGIPITTNPLTFNMPASAVTLTANFAPNTTSHQLTRTATAGGTITGTANGTHPAGSAINLQAVADSGHRFVNWTGSGIPGLPSTSATLNFSMPTTAVSLTANFAPAGTGLIVSPNPQTVTLRIPASQVPLPPQATNALSISFTNEAHIASGLTLFGDSFIATIEAPAGFSPAIAGSRDYTNDAHYSWRGAGSIGMALTPGTGSGWASVNPEGWPLNEVDWDNPAALWVFNSPAVTARPSSGDVVITIPNVIVNHPDATISVGFMRAGWRTGVVGGNYHTFPLITDTARSVTLTGAGEGATGGGSYMAGDTVYVFAGVNPGHVFSHWSGEADLGTHFTWNRRSDTFTMPSTTVNLTANWHATSSNRGDVNGDGSINSDDATMLTRFLLATDKFAFIAANPTFNWNNANVRGPHNTISTITTADLTLLKSRV
jgi:uncharacterized repeat protein (TIGR02543 family)